MKQHFIRFFYLFFVSLLIIGCEAESLYLKDTHHQSNRLSKTRLLKGNEAKDVLNQLNSKLQNAGLRPIYDENIQMRTIGQSIDFNSILRVIDTLGIKNYTFRILNHPSDDYKTFHNLVVTDKGTEIETTLMKYEMKEAFAQQYKAGLKLFQQFEGKVTAAGFSLSPLTPKPCEEVVKDIIPIPDFSVVSPTPGGGASPSGGGSNGGIYSGVNPQNGSGYGTGPGGGSTNGATCIQAIARIFCSCGRNYGSLGDYASSICGDWEANPGYDVYLGYINVVSNNCRLATDPCNPDGEIGVLEPIDDECSKTIATTFVESLSNEQKAWWDDSENASERTEIENYIKDSGCGEESKEFAEELIEQMHLNPELKLDINASAKSPAFVDMSSIDASTPEGAKFNEVYDALKTSPLFRNLFTDMFNQTPFINVKFKIDDIPQTSSNGHKDGTCQLYYYTDYSNLYNIITIDRNHLLNKSNLDIALTIIHEYIHAYLNVKFRTPSVGQPIPFSEINNKDLKDCINTYYNGFSGNQTQHSFFSDFMVPTIREILSNVKNILVSSQQANGVQNPTNGGAFLYYPLTNPPQLGQISDTYATWNWNTFFNYFAFNGLQNCTSYPYSKPTNQNHIFNDEEDFFHYYYISVYNTIFNQ